jgi:hypothetical protein
MVEEIPGICARADGHARLEVEVANAPAGATMAYVVTSYARESLPREALATIEVPLNDICDPDEWLLLWLDPVPGSIAYQDNTPVLIIDTDHNDVYGRFHTVTPTGFRRIPFPAVHLQPRPSTSPVFPTDYSEPSCAPIGRATARLSLQLARCESSIAGPAARRIRALQASGAPGSQIAAVAEQRDQQIARRCGPIRQRINERFQRSYEQIQERFAEGLPEDFGRLEQTLREIEGRPRGLQI